ncbi:dynein regulatory complex protein 9 [Andrena cerasifolii]|uniref:dynein regulatory complex protein 9 n=1 Tax=Andrena cerasifolii TaxID=2819439 RepID=UPI00403789E5
MATLRADGSSGLSPVERQAILALLEEYANALAIYHNTLEKPLGRDNCIPADCIFSGDDDLDVSSMQLDLDDIARIEDAKEEAASAKLYEDSSYVRNIVEALIEEISERGTYKILSDEVEKITARRKEEEALLAEKERLEKLAVELQKTIAEEKIANDEEKRRMMQELAEEQRSLEKLQLTADVELKYFTAWEEARCEQNALQWGMEIERLERTLNECRVREKNQERVHRERMKFLMQETENFERKTKEWEERYAREKEMYENEIRQLRIEIATRQKELDELKNEYRSNQEFIDTYLAEKEALRREEEEKERARRSAIRIQAWWRGVMVRRKLGPYRPEEKKKKRPAKTKK